MPLDLFNEKGTGLLDRETALTKAVAKEKQAEELKAEKPEAEKPKRKAKPKSKKPPKGFVGPTMMECGHWSYRKEKDGCKASEGKSPGNVRHLSEKHGIPVPKHHRRTFEKHEIPHAFPGLCCDDDGQYIGGIGNDCRFGQKPDSGKRCIVHRK